MASVDFVTLGTGAMGLAASISEKLGDGKLSVRELVEVLGELRALVEVLWQALPIDEAEYVELSEAVLEMRDNIDEAFVDGKLDVWEAIDLISQLSSLATMAREALTD